MSVALAARLGLGGVGVGLGTALVTASNVGLGTALATFVGVSLATLPAAPARQAVVAAAMSTMTI